MARSTRLFDFSDVRIWQAQLHLVQAYVRGTEDFWAIDPSSDVPLDALARRIDS